jgi:hypothetical protein
LLLKLREASLDRGEVLLHLRLKAGLLGGHLHEPVEVVDVALQRRESLQALAGAGMLGGHLRRRLRVIPEARRLHLPFERLHTLPQ